MTRDNNKLCIATTFLNRHRCVSLSISYKKIDNVIGTWDSHVDRFLSVKVRSFYVKCRRLDVCNCGPWTAVRDIFFKNINILIKKKKTRKRLCIVQNAVNVVMNPNLRSELQSNYYRIQWMKMQVLSGVFVGLRRPWRVSYVLYPIVFAGLSIWASNGLQKCYLFRSSSKAPSWCTCFDWWTCPGFGLNSDSTAKRDSKVFLKQVHKQQISNPFESNWIITRLHDNYRSHK